jgi:anaerobic selenocysteine-containing dehydrogenase
MSDTARYADIVLPATSQLEQVDIHKAYGHRFLHLNNAAIAPLGEAVSNWDLMRKLAAVMGFTEPWLRQTAEEVAEEILTASAETNPYLRGITFEQLARDGVVELNFEEKGWVPFSDGIFPTPSGKIELYSSIFAERGLDPLPFYEAPAEFANRAPDDDRLILISAAAHHFVSSSMANQPNLEHKEGTPFVEINPVDAAARGIADGDEVLLENARGWTTLRAVVTGDTQPGVAVAPKGRWAQRSPGGRGINWTTSSHLGDTGGHATFHSNLVRIRPATTKGDLGLRPQATQ